MCLALWRIPRNPQNMEVIAPTAKETAEMAPLDHIQRPASSLVAHAMSTVIPAETTTYKLKKEALCYEYIGGGI